jgi:hypothetical protein
MGIPFILRVVLGPEEQETAANLWRNSEELVQTNHFLEFIGSKHETLSLSARHALIMTESTLALDVLYCIGQLYLPQPTDAQRIFVLQLRSIVEFDTMLKVSRQQDADVNHFDRLRSPMPEVHVLKTTSKIAQFARMFV